ncbi:L,D-transpeptidase family protein [Pseudochrobactrum algeriensis]|uniref:L,D-transpeptidase family protein n=1 Tax=Pseudochrobactrum algeriensis TaxID=2834768 RepID=UPI001BCF04B9|nr:L,D-transpeptidase family protein [Pseudochrobactrum algeriensis]QVQ37079.1 L,D-transpeptidase family protein [Pseudochrobactrum algeriensis]QVQ40296.1 L,D-transpeptidase family protein [Pseudochrobactrum algeriensis]QVQ44219.1 L,D-transpeptidase family protein [Pseudochrobactrum algeriensis]
MSSKRRKTLAVLLGLALTVPVAGFAYTKVLGRFASGTAPAMAAVEQQADKIIVRKSARELQLLRGDEVLRIYRIALGGAPEGHKLQEGDQKTPVGNYVIDWRNPRSMAHLSLHISYPNEQDAAKAKEANISPGGNIMIHGLPNGWSALGAIHHLWDWTDGCVAVTNSEMREIWSLVPNGTPISLYE